MLYRIELSYACYGVITNHDKVISTPPIARWMIGKQMDFITLWVTRKGGTVKKVE